MFGQSEKIYLHHLAVISPTSFSVVLVFSFFLFGLVHPAQAAVVATGDVELADPASWTSGTTAYIGKTGSGTLSITSDSDVLGAYVRIGSESGSTGEVTVDGIGSSWTTNGFSALAMQEAEF